MTTNDQTLNEDWIKTLHWDLPTNLPDFLWAIGVVNKTLAVQNDELEHFTTLPSWQVAPAALKAAVEARLNDPKRPQQRMGRFSVRDWAEWDLEHPYVPHPKEASAPTQTYVSHADNPRPGMGDIKLSPGQIESMRTGSAAPFMNDKGEFTPERQALHDKIVSDAVNGVSPSEHPELIMTGGGGGSGKSAMLDQGLVPVPDSYVKNDPDAIKAELPEAEQMQADGDKTWAAFTHEESSYLSARIVDASYSTGKSMVLDTTGNTNAAKIGAKIQAARDAGYSVTGNYMTVTPDAGVARAMARADATGREVPEAVLRSTYKSISDVFPQVSEVFDKVNLFDNNGPKGSTPTLIASGGRGVGGLTVHDAAKYNQFLSYGSQ